MNTKPVGRITGLLLFLILAAPATRAADSYDSCTGFITSLPAVITSQGTWCLNGHLSTSLGSGNAISIETNNVTVDCNHFKLGGLGAGPTTTSIGIYAENRLNITVRNCNIRGFRTGIALFAFTGESSGHLIENNLVEGSNVTGIGVGGTGNTVRNNRVFDSGGNHHSIAGAGMRVNGDAVVIDNTIDGVIPASSNPASGTMGIGLQTSSSALLQGNRISNVDGGTGLAYGIAVWGGTFATVDRNVVSASGTSSDSSPFNCSQPVTLTNNFSHGFTSGIQGCTDDGGNILK